MKRILLINFGRMGDILQTAPLITFLKERYPGSVIGLMGAAHFREVIEGIPDVDALHVVPLESLMLPLKEGSLSVHYKIFQDFLKSITGYDYDTVFNLTHNRLGAVLSSLLPGEKIGLTLDEEGFAAVKNPWMRHFQNASINRGFNQFNLVDLYKLSAGFKSGQLTKDNSRLRYNVSEKARAEADKLLQSSGVKDSEILIGFQPGASAEAKRWPAEYWNELGKALSERYRIIIFGSPKESELAQEAAEGIANAINLAGKTTIPLLAALLQKCSLLISNDTGTQHLASAVGTRVLSLALGPALASETGPYGEGHLLLEPSIDCAPCNYQHPCSDFACHRLITPVLMEKIADALIRDDRIESIIQAADRVIVSRTCFDEGGLWEMKRLNPGGNEIRRRVNTAYRKTWLEMANDCNETSYDDDINGRGFALELDEAVSSVRSLIELAERGEREAEKLMRLADCQPLDIDAVKAAGGALAEIDSDIAAIGYKQDSARPLTLDFHFGKEALPNGDLKSMAEKTAGLYSNLRKASTLFLKYLGEKSPLTPLFQTEYLNNCYGRRGVYPPAKFAGGQAPGLPAHERRGKGIKILAVDYPYLVTGSILKALADKAAEFRTVRLTPDMMADPSQAERFIYQLLDTAGGFRPDFLFTVNHFGFDSEGFLIGELEKLGIKSAVYYVDSPDYVMPDPEKLKSLSQALFVWDNYYVEILRGQGFDNVHYLPLASDPEVFNPRRRNDSVNLRLAYAADSLKGAAAKYFNRIPAELRSEMVTSEIRRMKLSDGRVIPEILNSLADELKLDSGELKRNFLAGWSSKLSREERMRYLIPLADMNLTIFGDGGWEELFDGGKPVLKPPVRYSDELPLIYASADICFNWTHLQMPQGVNQRAFDVPAAAGFLLTDYRSALEEIFDINEDIAVYRSPEEAAEKARYYLTHPELRTAMAGKARAKILEGHTYRHRADYIIDTMMKLDYTYKGFKVSVKTEADSGKPEWIMDFKPANHLHESLIIDFPKQLDVPRELSIHHYPGKSLVIAPERAAWIVTDTAGFNMAQSMSQGATMGEAAASAAQKFRLDPETALMKLRSLIEIMNRNNFRESFDIKQVDIDRNPRSLQLFLTRNCNLSCRHCYFSAGESMNDELSVDEWKKVLRKFSLMGQGSTVTFTGGEPLTHPHFLEIAQAAADLGLRLILLTNGGLIDEAKAERLGDLLESAQVSLDGITPEINDAVRGAGSHAGAVNAVRLLLKHKVPVEITMVVLPENAGDIERNLGGFIASFDSDRITCALGVANPKGRLKQGHIDEEESLVGRILKRYPEARWLRKGRFSSGCKSFGCELATTIVINPQGKIGNCPYLNYTGPKNVRDSEEFSKLSAEDCAWHRRAMIDSGKCKSCDLRNFQCGGCKIFGECSNQLKQRSYFRMMERM